MRDGPAVRQSVQQTVSKLGSQSASQPASQPASQSVSQPNCLPVEHLPDISHQTLDCVLQTSVNFKEP